MARYVVFTKTRYLVRRRRKRRKRHTFLGNLKRAIRALCR